MYLKKFSFKESDTFSTTNDNEDRDSISQNIVDVNNNTQTDSVLNLKFPSRS